MSERKKSSYASRPKRALNPAFSRAHGIPISNNSPQLGTRNRVSSQKQDDVITRKNSKHRMNKALMDARSTGKLNLSNMGLSYPLADCVFNLRSEIEIDLSLSTNVHAWESFGEEELTLVDFSDNDFSNVGTTETATARVIKLDERIRVYKSMKTLRARRCQYAAIPMGVIRDFEFLHVLDLSTNNISHSFPLELMPYTLKELNISKNKIPSITEGNTASASAMIDLPYLTYLDVSHNRISQFPEQFMLPSLQSFFFGNNSSLESIPPTFISNSSSSLCTLEGPKCNIRQLPNLSQCSKLNVVDFSDNQIVHISSIHPSLMRLNLTNNSILSIQHLFSQTDTAAAATTTTNETSTFRSKLAELHLRANKIDVLPSQVMQPLTNLTFLDIGANELIEIPHILGYLPKLRKICLDGNPQRVIRASLAEDTYALKKSLRKKGLAPHGSDYIRIDEEADNFDNEVVATNIQNSTNNSSNTKMKKQLAKTLVHNSMGGTHTLDLSKKQLHSLPDEVLDELNLDMANTASHIKTFKLNNNFLQSIPENWIKVLSNNLDTMDANYNQLATLPHNMNQLPLSTLLLHRNALTSDTIEQGLSFSVPNQTLSKTRLSKHLEHLDVSCNALKSVPECFFHLHSLRTLILSNNKISFEVDKGDSWIFPSSLEHLDLSSNSINRFQPLVLAGCCPKLNVLLLNNNELKSIPSELIFLDNLRTIDLRGNPQKSVRSNILDRNCDAILTYLRGRMEPEKVQKGNAEVLRIRAAVANDHNMSLAKMHTESIESISKLEENSKRHDTQKEDTISQLKMTQSNVVDDRNALTSPLAEELRQKKRDLVEELDNLSLSQAKKYALKKSLAMVNAKLIREERRLKSTI